MTIEQKPAGGVAVRVEATVGRPPPFGLGRYCGWCGAYMARGASKIYNAERSACYCDQQCHDDAETPNQ